MFELLNVHFVLLVYAEDKVALALHPELIVEVSNLGVVKLLARLQFGGNLDNSGGRTSLSRSLHICALSLRSRRSGCDCDAWLLRVLRVERRLSSGYSKSLAEDISSGSLTCSLRLSASTYYNGHNGACHYAVYCSHCCHGLYEAPHF